MSTDTMMVCKCIRNVISNNVHINTSGNFSNFYVDCYYYYYIKIHDETGMLLYFVVGDPSVVSGHPFVEKNFKLNFDDTQAIREEKLNQILA